MADHLPAAGVMPGANPTNFVNKVTPSDDIVAQWDIFRPFESDFCQRSFYRKANNKKRRMKRLFLYVAPARDPSNRY